MATNKGGRPKFNIDYIVVEKLAGIGATQEEIAAFLGCSVRTLQRDKEFSHTYKKGFEHAKISIRRNQFNLSKTNASMGIWLGKQLLGQKEPESNYDQYKNSVVNLDLSGIISGIKKSKEEKNGTDTN